jgi:hypothetical protein
MLSVVTDRWLIAQYERLLRQNLRDKFHDEFVVDIWTPGGTEQRAKVLWSADLRMWTYWTKFSDRYWNPFGISQPSKAKRVKVSPNLEVNFPLHGIDRRFAGVFLQDDGGEIGIGHRGRIGGGRKGIGKSLFMRRCPEPFEEIRDGDKQGKVALVGALDSEDLPDRFASLVRTVIKMKENPQTDGSSNRVFMQEFEGARKEYSISTLIRAWNDHGRIVNELRRQIEGLGYLVGKDQARDLYITGRGGRAAALFEVKPDFASSYVYSAIGQLKYNALEMPSATQVAVLPRKTPRGILTRLSRLGIRSITFTMTKKRVVFDDLAGRLRSLAKS